VPDRTLAIRLAVIDGGKVKATLSDVGETGSRSLKRIEDAARPASRALQALDGVSAEVRGGLESLAGRLGPLGSALARIHPAALLAAAGLAAVGMVVLRGLNEAALADQSYRRLNAVLTATGHASGLTAAQIVAFSEGVERATLATAEQVQDAAAILATFRSVAGETFTRALTLAQDMAAVFRQDLSAAATQLGKALEDPVQGITALRRVGISFSAIVCPRPHGMGIERGAPARPVSARPIYPRPDRTICREVSSQRSKRSARSERSPPSVADQSVRPQTDRGCRQEGYQL
jgi:hypothetical protein